MFDSHKMKLSDEQNSSNQPNQSQSQSVIDQDNLTTRKTCLLLKLKRPVFKIDVKSFHVEHPDITQDVIGECQS